MEDPFQPTWLRAFIAITLAVIGFMLPQKIPLEYYPLNNPSDGLQYLEITCAANVLGETQIYLDTGRGFNELETIRWPIGPSEMAYTYTFPLPDAPLIHIRVDPFRSGPGELTITNFRIIDRREHEIHRFTKADFEPTHGIAAIESTKDSWKIVTAKADDPYLQINLPCPLIPRGMNERNLKRCLLSCGYLALMLWILLLAVYFSVHRPVNVRATVKSCLFLAILALFFAAVGNRGLIKNSTHYAHYKLPAIRVR